MCVRERERESVFALATLQLQRLLNLRRVSASLVGPCAAQIRVQVEKQTHYSDDEDGASLPLPSHSHSLFLSQTSPHQDRKKSLLLTRTHFERHPIFDGSIQMKLFSIHSSNFYLPHKKSWQHFLYGENRSQILPTFRERVRVRVSV